MDAIKFLKEQRRMCLANKSCVNCPSYRIVGDNKTANCITSLNFIHNFIVDDKHKVVEEAIEIVEKWSKEHPVKTRLSEFLKMFPNAELDNNGLPKICVLVLEDKQEECGENCNKCKEAFWNEEVE